MSAIESAVSKRIGSVSPNRKAGVPVRDADDRGTLMVDNVRNNPKRSNYKPNSPGGQEAPSSLFSRVSGSSKF